MTFAFIYDPDLDLNVPVFYVDFSELSARDRADFFEQAIRTTAKIPGKLKELDRTYMNVYERIGRNDSNDEELFSEMNRISEQICKLNALFYQIEGYFLQSSWHS